MIINRKLSGVLTIASDDGMRPALNAVLIKDGQAVATDGYMLMIVKLSDRMTPDLVSSLTKDGYKEVTEALIKKGDVKRILSNIPKKAKIDQLLYSWTTAHEEGDIEFTATDLEIINKIIVKSGTIADYPFFEKIIPKSEPTAKITVDADLLMKMLTAFKKTGIKNNHVTIEIIDKLMPFVLRATDLDNLPVYGLVMPVRVQE